MRKYTRIVVALALAIVIILSCTVVGDKLTDPSTYSHVIEVLDKNRTTILGLSAASAVTSAAVSALPDDFGSALADEISEFTSWFMLILSVIYLEKYLLTILGAVACYILIPVGCGALLINCFFPKNILQSMGMKLVTFALALVFVIPTSVWVSDQINAIYAKSIELTVQSANEVSNKLIGVSSNESEQETSFIDETMAFLEGVSSAIGKTIEQFKNVVNRFIEAIAVMLVTNCLIPILVILFFMWIVKTLFNVQIIIPQQLAEPKRKRLPREREHEKDDDLVVL